MGRHQSDFHHFSFTFVSDQPNFNFIYSMLLHFIQKFVLPDNLPHTVQIYFVFVQPISNTVNSNLFSGMDEANAVRRIEWTLLEMVCTKTKQIFTICDKLLGETNLIEMQTNWTDKCRNWLTNDEFEWKTTKSTLTFSHSSLLRTKVNQKRLKINRKTYNCHVLTGTRYFCTSAMPCANL